MKEDIQSVFADGGVIGRNPSEIGGTWAWCHVRMGDRVVPTETAAWDQVIAYKSGVVTPLHGCLAWTGIKAITNNLTEYLALAKCLQALPEGWSGNVYSDSQITLGRFFSGWKHEGIPERWECRMREIVSGLGDVTPILLDGHPTKKQLAAGIGKRGNPCSTFNVMMDRLCNIQAKAKMAQVIQGVS